MDPIHWLEELSAEIQVCTLCNLAATRTYAVPGEGDGSASIMFVGEGPGEQEDLSGRPFVGVSGQLLTRELEKIGIQRSAVFITNIVKCRPPGNRVPAPEEVEACHDYLMAQIALIEPKFIVPVGGPSLQTLVSKDLRIMKARSHVYRKDGILFVPILHPSAALRAPATMEQFKDDLLHLKDFLNREIREEEITEIGLKPVPLPRAPSGQAVELLTAALPPTPDEEGNLSLF